MPFLCFSKLISIISGFQPKEQQVCRRTWPQLPITCRAHKMCVLLVATKLVGWWPKICFRCVLARVQHALVLDSTDVQYVWMRTSQAVTLCITVYCLSVCSGTINHGKPMSRITGRAVLRSKGQGHKTTRNVLSPRLLGMKYIRQRPTVCCMNCMISKLMVMC